MSSYIQCTICGDTVRGYYGKAHPGGGWCKCGDNISGRKKKAPYANAKMVSYRPDFNFSTLGDMNTVENHLLTIKEQRKEIKALKERIDRGI